MQVPDAILQARAAEAPQESPPDPAAELKEKKRKFLEENTLEWLQDLDKLRKSAKSEHVKFNALTRLLDESLDKPASRQPKDDDDDIPGSIIVEEA